MTMPKENEVHILLELDPEGTLKYFKIISDFHEKNLSFNNQECSRLEANGSSELRCLDCSRAFKIGIYAPGAFKVACDDLGDEQDLVKVIVKEEPLDGSRRIKAERVEDSSPTSPNDSFDEKETLNATRSLKRRHSRNDYVDQTKRFRTDLQNEPSESCEICSRIFKNKMSLSAHKRHCFVQDKVNKEFERFYDHQKGLSSNKLLSTIEQRHNSMAKNHFKDDEGKFFYKSKFY